MMDPKIPRTKIKASEVKGLREKQLKKQRSTCPLCKTKIPTEDAAYDHCHKTGHLRMVLHRNCNTVEGKINNWMRWVPHVDRVEFLQNLIKYYKKDFSSNALHHTYGRVRRRRKRRRRL